MAKTGHETDSEVSCEKLQGFREESSSLGQRSAHLSNAGQDVVCLSILVLILQDVRKFLLLEETSWSQDIVMSVQTTALTTCGGPFLGLLEAKRTAGVR